MAWPSRWPRPASAATARILLTLSEDGVGQLWDGVIGRELPAIDADLPVIMARWTRPARASWWARWCRKTAVLFDTRRHIDPRRSTRPPLPAATCSARSGDRLLTWRCAGTLRSSGCLKLLDGQTGAEIAILDTPGEIMSNAQFSADGRWLFTPYLSGAVGVWDRDGHYFATAAAGATPASRLPQRVLVAANADGTRLATGGSNAPLQVLQLYPDAGRCWPRPARRVPAGI